MDSDGLPTRSSSINYRAPRSAGVTCTCILKMFAAARHVDSNANASPILAYCCRVSLTLADFDIVRRVGDGSYSEVMQVTRCLSSQLSTGSASLLLHLPAPLSAGAAHATQQLCKHKQTNEVQQSGAGRCGTRERAPSTRSRWWTSTSSCATAWWATSSRSATSWTTATTPASPSSSSPSR